MRACATQGLWIVHDPRPCLKWPCTHAPDDSGSLQALSSEKEAHLSLPILLHLIQFYILSLLEPVHCHIPLCCFSLIRDLACMHDFKYKQVPAYHVFSILLYHC